MFVPICKSKKEKIQPLRTDCVLVLKLCRNTKICTRLIIKIKDDDGLKDLEIQGLFKQSSSSGNLLYHFFHGLEENCK